METLLEGTRWRIVESISGKIAAATDLAAATSSSLPNVSQQLKLLEAYDIIERGNEERGAVGKPKQLYALKRPVCEITYARPGFATRRLFHPEGLQETLLNIMLIAKPEDQPCLIKLIVTHKGLLDSCAIGYLRNRHAAIELLLLTDNLEEMRELYSKIPLECWGKDCNFISWTHSTDEINEGLTQKDAHFTDIMKDLHVIHDPGNKFGKVHR